jgi:uncharacterized membrane protein YeaQ/YmgE (transglycosylase-associated protein family)
MAIFYVICIGFFVGVVAKAITPGDLPGGVVATILLGVLGGLSATYIGQTLGFYKIGEPVGFMGSLLGAVVILLVYRLFVVTPELSNREKKLPNS